MDTILVGKKTYQIINKTRELHDFCEYLVEFKSKKYIAKKYDLTSQMLDDVKVRKNLKKYGLFVPKYKKIDKKNNVTIEEYIEGKNSLERLLESELPDEHYKELYNVYRFCRFSKIDIDYMPENFILKGKTLYYMSFDYGPQNPNHNLENEGMYYWLYSPEFYQHVKSLGYDFDRKKILTTPEVKKKIVLLSIMNW